MMKAISKGKHNTSLDQCFILDASNMKESIQVGDRMMIDGAGYVIKILLPTLPGNQDITVFA